MIIAAYTKDFQKSLKKKDKFVQEKTRTRIRLFRQTSFNALLDNHKLHGKYIGYNSINITGNYRAIFKYITEDQVVFYEIGTHPELYG